MKLRLAPMLVCAVLAACGCEKKKDEGAGAGGACGPLAVTIDGKAVDGLVHAHAITQSAGDESNEQIHVFNREVTCEEVLGTAGREIADGEMWIRAGVGKSVITNGVGVNQHSELDVAVKLTSPAPAKVGDQVSMCIPRTVMKPAGGPQRGQTVVVSGTMTAAWCGVMEM